MTTGSVLRNIPNPNSALCAQVSATKQTIIAHGSQLLSVPIPRPYEAPVSFEAVSKILLIIIRPVRIG